jgi:hypothetical protein
LNRKEPLYRKVNTRTHGMHRHGGGEYKWTRGSKASEVDQSTIGSMHAKTLHGLDYTPLFKFLLSRVGRNWSETYGEAVKRLDREEPIFWLVARSDIERRASVRTGENSFFSGMFVDDNGQLALVSPNLRIEDMVPFCPCCTHTFNGKPFVRSFST